MPSTGSHFVDGALALLGICYVVATLLATLTPKASRVNKIAATIAWDIKSMFMPSAKPADEPKKD